MSREYLDSELPVVQEQIHVVGEALLAFSSIVTTSSHLRSLNLNSHSQIVWNDLRFGHGLASSELEKRNGTMSLHATYEDGTHMRVTPSLSGINTTCNIEVTQNGRGKETKIAELTVVTIDADKSSDALHLATSLYEGRTVPPNSPFMSATCPRIITACFSDDSMNLCISVDGGYLNQTEYSRWHRMPNMLRTGAKLIGVFGRENNPNIELIQKMLTTRGKKVELGS